MTTLEELTLLDLSPPRSRRTEPRPVRAERSPLDDPDAAALLRRIHREIDILQAHARRLGERCDQMLNDASLPHSAGCDRDLLHLRARADGIAACIRDAGRVLKRLDERAAALT
jgi:hypothetical protein